VGRDFHHDAPGFEVLELLSGGFHRRLVLHDVDVDVVLLTVGELAVDRLALPTFENLALIRKPISWTTEPSPMVSPSVVLWRSCKTERSPGTPVPPASSAAACKRLNENSVAKAAGPLAQNSFLARFSPLH
jgi:hypothetical protein